MLPRFAAAEDVARLAEVMSFALAACVLAERFGLMLGRASSPGWCPPRRDVPASATLDDEAAPPSYGALLLPRLVGDAGLDWLAQEPVALRAVAAYFGAGPSELQAIADEAARRVGLAVARPSDGAGNGASGPAASAEREEGGADSDGTEGRGSSGAPNEPPAGGRTALRPGPALVIGGLGAGWRWINWVRAGLRDGRIAVNAPGGWLYHIAGDAFVVRPACFEAVAATEGVDEATIKNRVAWLRKHRLRDTPRGAANRFRAELGDGRKVGGMLFPGELFWDDDAPPEADTELLQMR